MKKLIYIDNDHKEKSLEDFYYVRHYLKSNNVSKDILENIEILTDIHNLSKEELVNIIFDNNNVIFTWSVYTSSHYNSLGQLIRILITGGQCNIKGATYVDVSGEMLEILERELKYRDVKSTIQILATFHNNNIITQIDGEFKLIKVNIRSINEDLFETTNINILDYL